MSELKTLRDIPYDPSGLHYPAYALYDKALREAAKEWLNVFTMNREVDHDDEPGVDEAFIRIFFNLEDYNK